MLHEFTITIPTTQIDQAIEALNIVGLYNVYYEPTIKVIKNQNGYGIEEIPQEKTELKVYAEENETSDLPNTYLDLIKQTLHVSKDEVVYKLIDETDWNDSFADIELGNDWILCYSGDEDQYSGKQLLKFEPQAAFGTGLHETTQDCLRILLQHNFTGKSVLDLGTGSGVLSIGAGLKQAEKIVAVDYEPVEREILHNVHLNNISTPIEVKQVDLLEGSYKITEEYDWIFINIGADETVKIINRHDLLQKGSNFLVSGIVEWNVEKVIQAFKVSNLKLKQKLQSNEWITLHFGV